MVVGEPKRSIMEGIENTGDVRLHDHRLRLKQRFDIIRKLGQGTYGKVQLGINKKTGQEVAIKTIKKCKIETEADLVRIRREVQIMSSVRHPNIVHIYEVFENSEKMILVMEYCAGGELYDYLSQQKVLQEDEARRLFRQIATAVYYCHKHKICHRDLKLENVLLDEHGSAKIADFGLSNVFEERRLLSTFCGSPLYASPEIVKGTPYIGPEVDCWSLGVLLYTLVYGAMPFDGSNFKRLVKQISTGDYFEPKNPSSASPLIREMLTVDPIQRADIPHICDHVWVNKGSDVSCLELAEALANETPVRLDLLLSLAPPPSIGSDKLVVTDEVGPDGSPARSMSVANIDHSAERRILEMVAEGGTDAIKPSPTRTIVPSEQPKRKLETTVSMDSAPSQRKKERIVRSSSGSIQNLAQAMPVNDVVKNDNEIVVNENNVPEVIQNDVKESEPKPVESNVDLQIPSAPVRSATITVPKNLSQVTLEIPNENANVNQVTKKPSPEKINNVTSNTNKDLKTELKNTLKEKSVASKPIKKKIVSSTKKDDKVKTEPSKEKSPPRKLIEKDITGRVIISDKKPEEKKIDDKNSEVSSTPNDAAPKPSTERRRSRILDTAEKLNNLTIQQNSVNENSQNVAPVVKPKKVVIPGVSVGSFKEQFERRASLTSGNIPVPSNDVRKAGNKVNQVTANNTNSKTGVMKKINSVDSEHPANTLNNNKDVTPVKLEPIAIESLQIKDEPPKAQMEKKPVIVEINKVPKQLHKSESLKERSKLEINNDLSLEEAKRSLQQPANVSLEDARRSLQQSMALLNQAKNEAKSSESVDEIQRQKQLKTAREIISNAIGDEGRKVHRICMGAKPPVPYGSGGRSASGTISLSSLNSLPSSPPTSPPHPRSIIRESPARTFRTEVQHRVDDVRNKYLPNSRGGSVERIIPIQFADDSPKTANTTPTNISSSGQLPYQRNNSLPFRLNSIPRGSSQEHEAEFLKHSTAPSTPANFAKVEPIRKSPREFIIPIAVEGKGYVTPRQGSLEPTDTPTKLTPSNIGFASRFPKPRRISSLVSGGESEDEDDYHMHRLRSSRRVRTDAEKDSVSSGEEDDDEGFELLTAENLFSTLLDRVRSLTNRLNGEEGTGFPQHHSIFNNLHSPFFNSPHLPRKHLRHNLIREAWTRGSPRDLTSNFDSMFPSHTTFPRGSKKGRKGSVKKNSPKSENLQMANDASNAEHVKDIDFNSQDSLDFSDLDLSKLEFSEKEMETLSGLTPALSRRLQKQLLDHLPPAAARSLRRTLSMNYPNSFDTKSNHAKYFRSLSASKTPENRDRFLEDILEKSSKEINKNDNVYDNVEMKFENNNKYMLPSFDEDDTSSISYVSTLSRFDKENNKVNGDDYFDSVSLKDEGSIKSNTYLGKEPHMTRNIRNTPDKSVLSKYFSQEKNFSNDNYNQKLLNSKNKVEPSNVYTDSPYSSSNNEIGGLFRRHSLRLSSAENTPRRRISRFLRPDFFDTPREESVYYRDKIDKENETQQVLREIRKKRNKSDIMSPVSPLTPSDLSPHFETESFKSYAKDCLSPLSATTPTRSRSTTPFYPSLDDINEIQHEYNKNVSEATNRITKSKSIENSDKPISNLQSYSPPNSNSHNQGEENSLRIKEPSMSVPETSKINDSYSQHKNENDTSLPVPNSLQKNNSKESKIARPKSYPTTTTSNVKESFDASSKNMSNLKIKKIENSDESNNNSVLIPCEENENVDSNGNVTVSFNINLPAKPLKISKTDDKWPQDITSNETRRLSPTKKKVVVKKKSSKVATAGNKSVSNESKKTEDNTNPSVEATIKGAIQENEGKVPVVKKKSVLQSIGQKFEKLRNDSFSKGSSLEKENSEKSQTLKTKDFDKKVKPAEVRNLREQSVPTITQIEPITESGLIKRAVTMTDMPTLDVAGTPSKRSVNKVLGLFKKNDSKANKNNTSQQNGQVKERQKEINENINVNEPIQGDKLQQTPQSQIAEIKPKRPTSLLLNGIGRRVQAYYGGPSDNELTKKDKKSKTDESNVEKSDDSKLNKKGLRLDFSRLPKLNQNIFNKRNSLDLSKEYENEDIKTVNAPSLPNEITQDSMIDIEQQSSNYESREPLSNGNISSSVDNTWSPDFDSSRYTSCSSKTRSCSPQNLTHVPTQNPETDSPESENVIDRIRRKSFYSRFNEKKNKRKSLLVGPGAKEYIPSARINPHCENDDLYCTNNYDTSLSSPSKYSVSSNITEHKPYLFIDKSDYANPTSPKVKPTTLYDPFIPSSSLASEKLDHKYPDALYSPLLDNSPFSVPKYSRNYYDEYDSRNIASEPKSTSSRYGRTLSLLSPGIYATYSPRSHTRNPAILLRDSVDTSDHSEDILAKIRSRKKTANSNICHDENQSLDTKFRSNHTHNSEHNTSANKME